MREPCGCGCRHGAAAVLRAPGIDRCCGGRLTLGQAAAPAGIPAEAVPRVLGERAET
jgi:iron-sulfur cluster repair protein YtfE (RIC family)